MREDIQCLKINNSECWKELWGSSGPNYFGHLTDDKTEAQRPCMTFKGNIMRAGWSWIYESLSVISVIFLIHPYFIPYFPLSWLVM